MRKSGFRFQNTEQFWETLWEEYEAACRQRVGRPFSRYLATSIERLKIAPHLPFAIPAGIGLIGWIVLKNSAGEAVEPI